MYIRTPLTTNARPELNHIFLDGWKIEHTPAVMKKVFYPENGTSALPRAELLAVLVRDEYMFALANPLINVNV